MFCRRSFELAQRYHFPTNQPPIVAKFRTLFPGRRRPCPTKYCIQRAVVLRNADVPEIYTQK